MSPSELMSLIMSRFKTGNKRTIFVEASPGVGKTEIAYQAAKKLGIGFKAIHAPLMQPEDYGFPVISQDRGNVTFIVSKEKFPVVGSDSPETGILLIDELSQCDNNGQKILAQFINEREIHGQRLKDGWIIVATGNRTTDRAGANRMLSHLRDRVTTVQLDVSLDDWTTWALNNGMKPELIAFIRFRPNLLNEFNSQLEINPSPRSWAKGVNPDIGVIDHSLEFEVFKGEVGEGPAAEFLSFVKIYRNLPSVDVILLNPATADMPSDPATLYALCGALSVRATKDNFGRIMTYVDRMPPEFSVLFVSIAIRRCPEIQNSQDFIKWASTNGKALLT
jgi:hypothetical protein